LQPHEKNAKAIVLFFKISIKTSRSFNIKFNPAKLN
jgi:hypothetical protein